MNKRYLYSFVFLAILSEVGRILVLMVWGGMSWQSIALSLVTYIFLFLVILWFAIYLVRVIKAQIKNNGTREQGNVRISISLILLKAVGFFIYVGAAHILFSTLFLLNIYGPLYALIPFYLMIRLLRIEKLRSIETMLHVVFLILIAVFSIWMILNFKM